MSEEKHLENLQEIRSIMERNTRFLSLSGLSGVMAGVCALIGAGIADYRMRNYYYHHFDYGRIKDLTQELILLAAGVFISALAFAYFFTARKARKSGEKVWNKTSKSIFVHLAIPLLAGGFLSLALIRNFHVEWVAPITLIFYGLACINASQKTVRDIFYLGLTCLILGVANSFFLGYGTIFWALGFGVAHILYGTLMYFKYDRKA